MIGLKIIIILLVIATFSTVSAGTLMPEISWFNFQGVEVLDGVAQIELIGWNFICECKDMNGNVAECTSTDFCALCVSPGGDGLPCSTSPNMAGQYFGSAGICDFDVTCPVP